MGVNNQDATATATMTLDAGGNGLVAVYTGAKIVNLRSIKVSSSDLAAGDIVQIYIMEKEVTAPLANPEDFAAYFKDEVSDYAGFFCLVKKELGIDFEDMDDNRHVYVYIETGGGMLNDEVDIKLYLNASGSGG